MAEQQQLIPYQDLPAIALGGATIEDAPSRISAQADRNTAARGGVTVAPEGRRDRYGELALDYDNPVHSRLK